MRAPSATVIEAMARVAARPEGGLILEYLRGYMNELQQACMVMEDPVKVRMLQGQQQMLDLLLRHWKP